MLISSCSNYQKIVKDGTPQEKLDAARKYYKAKDYLRAQPLLEELLGLYYGRAEREEIYYLFAYSYFGNHELIPHKWMPNPEWNTGITESSARYIPDDLIK